MLKIMDDEKKRIVKIDCPKPVELGYAYYAKLMLHKTSVPTDMALPCIAARDENTAIFTVLELVAYTKIVRLNIDLS